MNKEQKTFGIAIVGCGQIVTHHINAILSNHTNKKKNHNNNTDDTPDRFQIIAVCDPSHERRYTIIEQIKHMNQSIVYETVSSVDSDNNVDTTTTTTTTTATLQNEDNNIHWIYQFNTLEDMIHYNSAQQQQIQQKQKPISSMIDMILIAVPHDLHESITIYALEATQYHQSSSSSSLWENDHTMIVLEKPIAITKQACTNLLHASIQYQHRLMIAEQSPYWPAVVTTKQLIHEQNQIGTIISIASYYYESMRDNVTSGSVDDTCGALGWRGSIGRSGGGIIIDGGLHWIRPIREITKLRITKVIGVICPIPSIQQKLGMEGETLGHAMFELQQQRKQQPDDFTTNENEDTLTVTPLIATYSACMLPNPIPMAYDQCPYIRITGTDGEIIIAGTGLQKNVYNAGGVRLYNVQYPNGKEMLVFKDDDKDMNQNIQDRADEQQQQRTDFFMAFDGLWDEIYRIRSDNDTDAAHESVIRAIDDVQVVFAIYKSAQTKQWESI
jgi:predicted dehydrogenase